MPTNAEWEAEIDSLNIQNVADACNSLLKLPASGNRRNHNGLFAGVNLYGDYWSSTLNDIGGSKLVRFNVNNVELSGDVRACGYSVRCIKD